MKLDLDPGGGLCEALEQPSRIDSLFIERAMIKVTDNLRVLAAEHSATQHLAVDTGAIDILLHELRRKFPRIAVDLPRGASPTQRVVLAAASHVVVLCERTLAGLRDTIRLQSVVREQAPQARLWLVEAGATTERALISKADFEKGIGRPLDARLSYDPKSAGAAANSGQPVPTAAPRSAVVRELRQLAALPGWPCTGRSEAAGIFPSIAMVAFFKRPLTEETLDARIAVLSRRARPLVPVTDAAVAPAAAPAPEMVPEPPQDTAPEPVQDNRAAEAITDAAPIPAAAPAAAAPPG